VGPLTEPFAPPRRARARGFTLVEILVVLIVLAVASALLVASLERDPRRTLGGEARRLAGALEHAAALAQWTGETLGVSATGSSYRFWRRASDGEWTGIADDDVLAPRRLPEGIAVGVAAYAGAPVPADAILPFRASGRNEPYAVVMVSGAASAVLAADALNRVGVTERAPDPP
jgi:general secretion pathway protein H